MEIGLLALQNDLGETWRFVARQPCLPCKVRKMNFDFYIFHGKVFILSSKLGLLRFPG